VTAAQSCGVASEIVSNVPEPEGQIDGAGFNGGNAMIRSFWKLESCERKFSDLGWRIVQRHHGDPAHPTSPIYRSSCCLATERSETNTISRFRADVGAVLQADMRSGFPQPHLDFDHTDYQARGQPSPFFSDHQSPRIPCQNSYERRDSKAASFRGRRRLCLIASNNAALT
jgi:hypothetical protein